MKIAAFNVENLFDRAKVFNEESTQSKPILKAVSELNNLFEKEVYSSQDKKRMKELFKILGFEKSDKGEFALLRKIRGRVVYRPKKKPFQIAANGRNDWIGWVELKQAPVNETAVINTGRVIKDVNADVLAVIEAENRVALKLFSEEIIKKIGGEIPEQVMLVDGNDPRGIDVGVMTQNGYKIGAVRSHIHDLKPDGYPIFSRDSPEYEILTPSGKTIWVIPNHFKSKFGGDNPASKAKRLAQSKQVAKIYRRLIKDGEKYVVVLGDLNDTPDSAALKPLLVNTNLKDVSKHPTFDPGVYSQIGTYGSGLNSKKIDYLLLSPKLFDKVESSGLFRKGAWAGVRNGGKWPMYSTIKSKLHVASDHHVIWANIDI